MVHPLIWLIALWLVVGVGVPAQAQGCGPQNPNCLVPTAPFGTSNNQAASTAFVQGASTGIFTTAHTWTARQTFAGTYAWKGAGSVVQSQLYERSTPIACSTSVLLPGGGFRTLRNTAAAGDFSTSFSTEYECHNYNLLATTSAYDNGNVQIGDDSDKQWVGTNFNFTAINTMQQVKGTIVGGLGIQTDLAPIIYLYHATNLSSYGGNAYYPTAGSLMGGIYFSGDTDNGSGANGGAIIYANIITQGLSTTLANPVGSLYISTADTGATSPQRLVITRGLWMTGAGGDPGAGNIAALKFMVGAQTVATYGVDVLGTGNTAIVNVKNSSAAAGAILQLQNSTAQTLGLYMNGAGAAGGARGGIGIISAETLVFDTGGGVTFGLGTATLGVTGTTSGQLNFAGSTSGGISVKVQAAAGTYNFNLPTTAGTSGQVLTSAGGIAAPMTWTTPGSVTSIATTSPITGGTITTTGTIACATCVTSAAALTSGSVVIGAGSQASAVTTTGTGVVTALGVNVGSAGAFVTFNGAGGTPSSLTLTNATGLPVGSITGLGTGVATFLATPSSANLAAAVTDETGTGALVFAASPTLSGSPLFSLGAASVVKFGLLTTYNVISLNNVVTAAGLMGMYGSTTDSTLYFNGPSQMSFFVAGSGIMQLTSTIMQPGTNNTVSMGAASFTWASAYVTLTTDATHTDRTVCEDTTSHQFLFGSGAAGICLGTSGRQFKTDFEPLLAGIDELARINLQTYRYKPGYGDDGKRRMYGPTAQDVEAVLPGLAGHNEHGETINYDVGSLFFVGLRAIQELKADNDNLRAMNDNLASRLQKLEGNVR